MGCDIITSSVTLPRHTYVVYRKDYVGRTLTLQNRMNGNIRLRLQAILEDNGDFTIYGCDRGPKNDDGDRFEYIWEFMVKGANVPELVRLLGGTDGDDLLKIIERDWKPVQGEGLERRIRESEIPYNLDIDR